MPWNPQDWDAWIDARSDESCGASPHLTQVRQILQQIPDRERKTVGDLGRERVERLPLLESLFHRVLLVDPVDALPDCAIDLGMPRCALADLDRLRVRLDVTVAVDAIDGPRSGDVDRTLSQVHGALVEGGLLVATFPAVPFTERPFAMRLGPRDAEREPLFHEVDLQYRLQRSGFQGVRLRRVPASIDRGPSILCMAVRRAWN